MPNFHAWTKHKNQLNKCPIWPTLPDIIIQGGDDLFDLGVESSNGDGWGNDDDDDEDGGDAWESFEQGKTKSELYEMPSPSGMKVLQ